MTKMTHFSIIFTLTLACLPLYTCITYNITEEGGAGMKVGNVLQDSNIISGATPEFVSSLIFKFLPRGYEYTRYFTIAKHSGEIRTALNINREAVCDRTECLMRIMVGVQSSLDPMYIKVLPVAVRVRDINDNTPKFPRPAMSLNIPESVTIGTSYRIPAAKDSDLDKFGIVKYKIDRANKLFSIKYTKNLDKTFAVYIVIKNRLDREIASSHKIVVMAMDGGRPQKIGRLAVNVNVTDTNDHAPVFTQKRYSVKYREDVEVNSVLLTVSATDLDQGINARVYYVINKQTRREVRDMFSVNETSGEIRLVSELDYEKHHKYQFVVEAVDGGSRAHTSQALVDIQVENVNDNDPMIHQNLLTAVPENARLDHFIVLLTVTDADNVTNSNVVCKLNTHLFKLKQAGSNQYKLLLNTTLNHENTSFYDIVILCRDSGYPSRTTAKKLRINVTDVNDNKPKFTKKIYEASVKENCPLSTFILTVFASDDDIGNNSKVLYKLSNGAYPYFRINSKTGDIVTANSIDREFRRRHSFLVIATDQGDPALESTSEVIVNVRDVNDIVPYFAKDYFPFYFPENEEMNAVVGKVDAIDNDSGNNSRLTYSIIDNGETIPFLIDSRNGIIYTADVYDREERPEYRFKVSAVDAGSPRLTGTTNIAVFISDVNDNDPVIVLPRNTTFKVSYKSEQGSKVFAVKAYDRDFGNNGKLRYQIIKGNENNIVKINERDGVVTTARALSASDKGTFSILVEVTDGATPPRLSIGTYSFSVVSEITSSGTDHLMIIVILCVATIFLACVILAVIFILRRRRNKHLQRLNRMADPPRENGDALHHDVRSNSTLVPYHKNCEVIRSLNGGTLSKLSRADHQMSILNSPPSVSSVYTVNQHNMPMDGTHLVMNDPTQGQQQYCSLPEQSRCSTPIHSSQYSTPSSHCPLALPTDPIQMKQINEMLLRLDAHSDTSGDSGRGTSDGDANSLQQTEQRVIPNAITKPPRSGSRRPRNQETDSKISTWMYTSSDFSPQSSHRDLSPPGRHDLSPCHRKASVRFHPDLNDGLSSGHCDNATLNNKSSLYRCYPTQSEHTPINSYNKRNMATSSIGTPDGSRRVPVNDTINDTINDAAFDASSAYTDDSDATTTSGSYTVDADQLVNDIDNMFFGECVV